MTGDRAGGRLVGRVAIVSGGARGIGEAHVRALAGEGAHVVIGELSAERWRRTIDVNLTGHFLGIRVNSLHPGMIRTAMTKGAPEDRMAAKYPLRRFGTPEEVARTMLFIVCDATYASGDGFPVDGGIPAGIMMGE